MPRVLGRILPLQGGGAALPQTMTDCKPMAVITQSQPLPALGKEFILIARPTLGPVATRVIYKTQGPQSSSSLQ